MPLRTVPCTLVHLVDLWQAAEAAGGGSGTAPTNEWFHCFPRNYINAQPIGSSSFGLFLLPYDEVYRFCPEGGLQPVKGRRLTRSCDPRM